MRIVSITLSLLLIAAASAAAQKDVSIAQIQGSGNTSSSVDQSVRLTGIVTARTKTGFFLQTPDDKADADKNTSEGIFVFTRTEPPAEADTGNSITVTGTIEEFRRDNEPLALTITELSHRKGSDQIKVVSSGNTLPKPIVITASDFMSNSPDALEKFEGMRVQFDDVSVA